MSRSKKAAKRLVDPLRENLDKIAKKIGEDILVGTPTANGKSTRLPRLDETVPAFKVLVTYYMLCKKIDGGRGSGGDDPADAFGGYARMMQEDEKDGNEAPKRRKRRAASAS